MDVREPADGPSRTARRRERLLTTATELFTTRASCEEFENCEALLIALHNGPATAPRPPAICRPTN